MRELVAQDKQIQYAANAIKHYRAKKVPDYLDKDSHNRKLSAITGSANGGNHGSTHNSKRHIVNVDDTSKINYEMIKNSPGNLPMLDQQDQGVPNNNNATTTTDSEINTLKTKMYKSKLYEMNDDFLESISEKILKINKDKSDDDDDDIPLSYQLEWLRQIQDNLKDEYHLLVNEEKKWFVLKELLLDANAELDLFSAQDEKKTTIKLGSVNIPSNSNSNAMVFNRSKRQKIANVNTGNNPSNII